MTDPYSRKFFSLSRVISMIMIVFSLRVYFADCYDKRNF